MKEVFSCPWYFTPLGKEAVPFRILRKILGEM